MEREGLSVAYLSRRNGVLLLYPLKNYLATNGQNVPVKRNAGFDDELDAELDWYCRAFLTVVEDILRGDEAWIAKDPMNGLVLNRLVREVG